MFIAKEVLNGLAKIAADGYLTKKTSLNTSLLKIAKDESLEPHQIEYVAATANHQVWEKLFGISKTASYDFPVADAASVVSQLQVKPKSIIKEASLDYLSAPTKSTDLTKTASISLDPGVDKTAATKRQMKRELQTRFDKIAQAKDELERKMYDLRMRFDESERSLMKQARSLVIAEPFEFRGQAMDQVAEFVKSACGDSKELAQSIMKKLSAVMTGQGLMKQADLKAPEEYISDKLPAKIVNGRHALYITIQTLRDLHKDYGVHHQGYEICDSSLPELKEKIRAL